MSDYQNYDVATSSSTIAPATLRIPVAAVLILVIVGYIILVAIAFRIRSALTSGGDCGYLCGSEDDPCCRCSDCCQARFPDVEACLNSVCPARKRLTCADIITCNCCDGQSCCACCPEKFFDCGFDCQCQTSQDINCLCCTIRAHQPLSADDENVDS